MLDNHFQKQGDDVDAESAAAKAEHTALGRQLQAKGVAVGMIPNEFDGTHRPDAIFPNNSLSFHVTTRGDGAPLLTAYLYPMSTGRRSEVPPELLKALTTMAVQMPNDFRLMDLRAFQDLDVAASAGISTEGAPTGLVLEGTGVLVFSHDASALYMGRSQRAHEALLEHISSSGPNAPLQPPQLREVHSFTATDRNGRLVYHTNVVGWCGVRVAAWCMEAMKFDYESAEINPKQSQTGVRFYSNRHDFEASFAARGVRLLALSFDEMDGFAGNALELFDGTGKPILTLSGAAWANLSAPNRAALLEAYGGEENIVVAPIPTIERLGGGSVRCLQCHLNYPVKDDGTATSPAVEALKVALTQLTNL
jgi:hypothetical protein